MPQDQRPPRSRVGAIALSAALIAGLGGFLLGHAVSRTSHPNSTSTAGSEPPPTVPPTTIPSGDASTSVPPTTAETATTDASIDETASVPRIAADTATTVNGSIAESGGLGISSGGPGSQLTQNAYGEPPQTLIAQRTTSTGITIRAHRQMPGIDGQPPYPGTPFLGVPSFVPAAWCYPAAELRISVITDSATNVTFAPWYSETRTGLSASSFAAGYVEGTPVFGLAAEVTSDVATVTFTTASGLTDTATPVAVGSSGLALLAVSGPIEQTFSVTITKQDGTSTTLASADLRDASSSEYHTSCEPPPPALPPAGEQPADPAAAEAAVRESWRIVHDYDNSTTDPTVRIGRVDDPTGVRDAWTAIANGQYADVAKAATTPIKELVFTSPTEAWIRYDVINSITNFYDRYGKVELGSDGVWRVTRQTICGDISLATVQCDPAVDQLLPPSAANDPRYGGATAGTTVTTVVIGD